MVYTTVYTIQCMYTLYSIQDILYYIVYTMYTCQIIQLFTAFLAVPARVMEVDLLVDESVPDDGIIAPPALFHVVLRLAPVAHWHSCDKTLISLSLAHWHSCNKTLINLSLAHWHTDTPVTRH